MDSISYDSREADASPSFCQGRLYRQFQKAVTAGLRLYQRDRLSSGHSGLNNDVKQAMSPTAILRKAQTACLYWHQGRDTAYLPIKSFPKVIDLPCSRLWTLLWWRVFFKSTLTTPRVWILLKHGPSSLLMIGPEVSVRFSSRNGPAQLLMSVSFNISHIGPHPLWRLLLQ